MHAVDIAAFILINEPTAMKLLAQARKLHGQLRITSQHIIASDYSTRDLYNLQQCMTKQAVCIHSLN